MLNKGLKIGIRRLASRLKPGNYIDDHFDQIEIETTTFCNRKCSYCPNVKYERFGPEDDFYMNSNVFEKLIIDLSDNNFKGILAPHHYGEPLSDGSLYLKLDFINRYLPEAKIKIVTNGDYLNLTTYKELISRGVKIINISKHSEHLSDGCNQLLLAIKNDETKEFKVHPKVIDFWKDFKNESEYLFNRGGDIKIKEAKLNPIKCVYASYPVINVYGDLILCCQDYKSDYILGNIMEKSIYEIWRSSENKLMRERIMRSYFDNDICKNCLFTSV